MSVRKTGDVRLEQFLTLLVFLHCVIALLLQSLEQHQRPLLCIALSSWARI